MKINIMSFSGSMPGKLADDNICKKRWSQNDVSSVHIPDKARGRALAIDSKIYEAARLYSGFGERKAYIALLDNGGYLAEIQEGNESQVCLATRDKLGKWHFKAAMLGEKKTLSALAETRNGTIFPLVLMPEILKDLEANDLMQEMQKYLKIDPSADDWDFGFTAASFSKALCAFTTNVYYRLQDSTLSPLLVDTEAKLLRNADLKDASARIKKEICGKSKNFTLPKSSSKGEKLVVGKYALKGTVSEADKALIPIMPDYYIVPKWVDSACTVIKESTDFSQPFRNLLLTGPSGTGKTTGVKAMAALMGLPYTKITCNPDTDIFDLVGQMLPNTSKEKEIPLGIPTFEDVENDFENSYMQLFGSKPGRTAAPSDCYEKISELRAQRNGKDFVFVESDLIRAYRNGYFIEIQEPTVLKRSSVLVGLNSLLENDSQFTLPTGEVIQRHPNCVICLTTNSDYDGCNMIQQSVLSRMDFVREVPNPLAEELKERTMKQTGFGDEALLLQMSELIGKINEFCQEKDITDGICGPRELANWAKMSMVIAKISGEPLSAAIICQAAFSTLINKVSQEKEDAESVISGCLGLVYPSDAIEIGREMYESGF